MKNILLNIKILSMKKYKSYDICAVNWHLTFVELLYNNYYI